MTREQRATNNFACPTCGAYPGELCRGLNGQLIWSPDGPGCHTQRRRLLKTLNKIDVPPPAA